MECTKTTYSTKRIAEFLKAANRDLGDGKYTGYQMIPDYCMAVNIGKQLQAKVERLKEALFGHRWDMHERSKRPCSTCRKSAEVLGLKVPDHCAYERLDKQALKERKEDVR